ncbi:hypothetical protein A4G31_07805 [Mycobacterium persicum]|nr:hypothetical protein A4G31_07805 [Mycobacterium persicum]
MPVVYEIDQCAVVADLRIIGRSQRQGWVTGGGVVGPKTGRFEHRCQLGENLQPLLWGGCRFAEEVVAFLLPADGPDEGVVAAVSRMTQRGAGELCLWRIFGDHRPDGGVEVGELLLDCLQVGSVVDDFLYAVQLVAAGIGIGVEGVGFDAAGEQQRDAHQPGCQGTVCSIHEVLSGIGGGISWGPAPAGSASTPTARGVMRSSVFRQAAAAML